MDHNIKELDSELREKVSKRNFYHKAEAQIRPDVCYTSEEQPSEETIDYSDSNQKEEIDAASDQDISGSCTSDQSTDNSLSYSQVYSEIYEESIVRQQRADKLCRAYHLNKSPIHKTREGHSSDYPEDWAYRTDGESQPSIDRSLSSEAWSDVAQHPEESGTDELSYDSIKTKLSAFLESLDKPDSEEQQTDSEEENSSVEAEDSDDQSFGELDYDALIQEQLRIINEYKTKDAIDSVRSSYRRSITSDVAEFDSEQSGENEAQSCCSSNGELSPKLSPRELVSSSSCSPRSLQEFHSYRSAEQKQISQAECSDREMADDTGYPTCSESSTRSTISRSSLPTDYLCRGTRHHHQRRQRRCGSVPKTYQDRGNSPISIKTARCSSLSEKVNSKSEGSKDCFITRSIASIGLQYPSDVEQKVPKKPRSPLGLRFYNADEALMELPDCNAYAIMDENSDYLDLSVVAKEDQISAKLLAAALTTKSRNKSTRRRTTPTEDTCHQSILNCMSSVIFKRRSEPERDHRKKDRLYWIAERILSASLQRCQDIPMEYVMARAHDDDRLRVDISSREIRTLEFHKKFQQQVQALEQIFQ
ncbi:uncharacterized protein LOC111068335 [Drosophila obscura]|uniref:uncharacterized protein LOC111068335 n=1 Tax=Drosophila obscura TaxID=7282 RepID=UPI001BB12BCC|nr:uncharacterized protein LOC111068335 [Drosophila obscura]